MSRPVVPFPANGELFLDARGGERCLRVSWHHDRGLAVISLWRGDTCVGTLQLARDEVPGLISALANGLAEDRAPRRAS